ncbi:hypothetical protein UPYG_G00151080 [Umbra pygmaea]|uniref:Centrosomal protein of 162 kDa n=1 Tax=Umbra pygmaea TaxID=75934 RepID=A0ABD0XLV3_UMBPY
MAHQLSKNDLDEQFELFLKESVSDDSVDLDGSTKCSSVIETLGRASHELPPKNTSATSVMWWQKKDSEETPGRGILGSGKTFRKSLRRSQPIQEEEEEQQNQEGRRGSGTEWTEPDICSRDSLEPGDSVMPPAVCQTVAMSLGLDTLEEEVEKSRFFAQLEGGASSTIDYSKLNRALDSSTTASTLGKAEVAVAESDQREKRTVERILSPVSPDYSEDEDFEDEESGTKKVIEEESKKPAMLAKVSLHDSLDSTGDPLPLGMDIDFQDELRRIQRTEESKKREKALLVQSYGQSGASDMEALQDAYRQISGSVEHSDHHRHPSSPVRKELNLSSNPVSASSSVLAVLRGTIPQSASTTESELHTAEELMHLIQPHIMDDTSSFNLQPASGAQLSPEKTGQSYKSRHSAEPGPAPDSPGPAPDSPGPAPDSPGPAPDSPGPAPDSPGPAPDSPGPAPDSPGPQTRSVREEEQLLMHNQNSHSSDVTHTQPSKAKRRELVSGPCAITGESTLSLKKPYVAPGRGRRLKSASSAMASRTSGHGRPGLTRADFSSAAKPPFPLTQKDALSQTTYQSLDPIFSEEAKGPDCDDLRVSSERVPGLQSFATFLQQQHQIEMSGCQDTYNIVSQKSKDEQDTSKSQETELVLERNLHSAEKANSSSRWGLGLGNLPDQLTDDKLRQIEKEMKEQETLIQGYQQENEKLYLQVKDLQRQYKLNEESMFTEHQKLLNKLAFTKEQLSKSTMPRNVRNIDCVDHTQHITELLGQLKAAEKTEERLLEETQRLKQDKQSLEVDLQMMKKERDLAKAQVVYTSGDKVFELQVTEARHKEEVCALKKRLQWYAENQELLDQDAARLKAATAETHKLTEQVQKLKMEVGKRANEGKVKQRAREAKRIQDLERQVKEMENILRRRNPNSLPALIYIAANTPAVEENGEAKSSMLFSQTTGLLEQRIQRLDAELESHDQEAKRSLRAMEQQYQRIKLQYEKQISDLMERLAQTHQPQDQTQSTGVWEAQIHSLQQEMEHLKETHQSREKTLQAEVQSLQQQLIQQSTAKPGKAVQHSPSRFQLRADTALGERIERLNQELSAKTRTIKELSHTVDRLQKERKTMLSGPSPRLEAKRHIATPKGPVVVLDAQGERGGTERKLGRETTPFPQTQDEKDYQPTVFSGSHISEVLQESQGLRLRLEQLEQQRDEESRVLQAAATQAQAELCRVQEQSAEQLSSLKAEHQRELEQLFTHHALAHSSSNVAKLTNQVTTQEIMLQHLRDQVKELQGAKDALALSKLREDTLQNQLTKLLEELKQAKEYQSPELRHFSSLESKIHNMELRHAQREKELQQVIDQTRLVVDAEQLTELERWKSLAKGKSQELEVFRLELDCILDVLKELQKKGVFIPPPSSFTWRT